TSFATAAMVSLLRPCCPASWFRAAASTSRRSSSRRRSRRLCGVVVVGAVVLTGAPSLTLLRGRDLGDGAAEIGDERRRVVLGDRGRHEDLDGGVASVGDERPGARVVGGDDPVDGRAVAGVDVLAVR